ncbi:fungal specific transcription factor, putative [Talaromyces stipitatus ATCC 10500]|uniref:Fungal specific transcription factor, putative n=1 Tax=Talaromyces stipitatus (strain ATCC 10500 / CBS 375.48 / QM 6759 / NRRL 1006) TaxID=441959 RepID=B8LY93_TALSN|nr:fungal specific transcription factor, putative [Talaromyces stipitatus ATCC 10500]EED23338.1 fungal specific transcription factor, putative [Talaromyces stipitatus ATCC 10500]
MSTSQVESRQPSGKGKKAPRKHVTTACVPCRESKIRCDGTQPNCLNCQKKEKACRYQHGDDKRKISLRAATELFSARIDQLTQFIYNNGLQPPSMRPDAEQEMNRVLDTLQVPRSLVNANTAQNNANLPRTTLQNRDFSGEYNRQYAPPNNRYQPSAQFTNITNHEYLPPIFDFSLPTAEILDDIYANNLQSSSLNLHSGQPDPYTGIERTSLRAQQHDDDSASDSGDEAEREVIEQLSSRIGTLKLAGDGHLRFYGPTSNLTLVDVASTSKQIPGPDVRSVRHDGQELLNHLRIGQQVEPSLEDHLIELYFTWQNPSLYIVDREMFTLARAKWRDELDDTPFYSEVLTNAMCALGAAFEARYHPTFITFPKSLSEFFADRAKALLEIELDCPCVATVQALAILSSHEAASNRDARGWLYSGMSMRLAYDLGLHLDMASYVERGSMTPMEAKVRRITFWGSYIADHFWGFYLGRPFRMNAGDVSVSKPASGPDTKEETWYAYGMGESLPSTLEHGLRNPGELITQQFVNLWEMIAPVGHILYGCSDIESHDLQRMNYKVTEDLFAWKRSLAPSLQIDLEHDTGPVLPHLLMLHMQYYQIVIFFHRPWVSKSYIQPQNPKQGPGHQHARRTCAESATAIARLLRLYEKYYTFRRINNQVVAIIFTAALMLIFVTISMSTQDTGRLRADEKNRQVDMATHLNVCFRALDELGQSFENAKRTRDFLVSLQRRWQNHMRKTGGNSKRSIEPPGTRSSRNGEDGSPSVSAAPSSDQSLSRLASQKKPRLAEQSMLEDSRLGVNFVNSHEFLPPDVEFGSISNGGLNWTPSSRDLKMLSEEIGDAPLFSTTSSPSSTSSQRQVPGGMATFTSGTPGGSNAISSLGEMAHAWWTWPADGVNGLNSNHRSDRNVR